MELRYYIDERLGCIAVMDREKAEPESNLGLNEETPGVVKFWMGVRNIKQCPTCSHFIGTEWEVPERIKKEAKELCAKLNKAL